MKGFDIGIKNNVLDRKHIEQMGSAIWLFMWFIDKTTKEENGIGKVWKGAPIKFKKVQEEMGITERTYNRWLSILKKYEYIDTRRTPYGLVVSINKTKKKRYADNGGTLKRDTPKTPRDTPYLSDRYAINGGNKLRHNKDITKDIDSPLAKVSEKTLQGKEKLYKKWGIPV